VFKNAPTVKFTYSKGDANTEHQMITKLQELDVLFQNMGYIETNEEKTTNIKNMS